MRFIAGRVAGQQSKPTMTTTKTTTTMTSTTKIKTALPKQTPRHILVSVLLYLWLDRPRVAIAPAHRVFLKGDKRSSHSPSSTHPQKTRRQQRLKTRRQQRVKTRRHDDEKSCKKKPLKTHARFGSHFLTCALLPNAPAHLGSAHRGSAHLCRSNPMPSITMLFNNPTLN